MKSAILFLCFTGLVMGYDETCEAKGESCVAPEDEVGLMQIRTQVHKHEHSKMTDTDMQKVLASFKKKEGPGALQELVQGLMVLPVLMTEEAMRAAFQAQPQLRHLARRYPQFLFDTLGIFEDPKAIQQIKAAVFKEHHSPVKMQGRRPRPTQAVQLLGKRSNTIRVPMLAWTEGWGCTTNLSHIVNPEKNKEPEEWPLFGPTCTGWPWVSTYGLDRDAGGVYYMFGNSSDVNGTWVTRNTVVFANEKGSDELLEVGNYSNGMFDIANKSLTYINEDTPWPNTSFSLVSADLAGSKQLTTLTKIKGCYYPSSMRILASGEVVWTCSKDWQVVNDTAKIMKWTPEEGVGILAHSDDYFGYLTVNGPNVYYSQWVNSVYEVYSLPVASCDKYCTPLHVGVVPGNAWQFFVTESGRFITSQWNSVGLEYDVMATDDFGNGTATSLFTNSDYLSNMQMSVVDVPDDGIPGQVPDDDAPDNVIHVSGTLVVDPKDLDNLQ